LVALTEQGLPNIAVNFEKCKLEKFILMCQLGYEVGTSTAGIQLKSKDEPPEANGVWGIDLPMLWRFLDFFRK